MANIGESTIEYPHHAICYKFIALHSSFYKFVCAVTSTTFVVGVGPGIWYSVVTLLLEIIKRSQQRSQN